MHSPEMRLKEMVLIIGPLPPPCAGPEQAMKALLDSPLSEAFDVSFLNTNFRKTNAEKGKPGLAMVGAFFVFFAKLILLLASHRPKLVYYFVTATELGWIGRDVWCIFMSRLFGVQVAIHMHAGHFRRGFLEMNFASKWLIKRACSVVSLALVQGEALRTQFMGLVGPERIVTIPNAIDVEKYSKVSGASYDPCCFLFLGHLSTAKGYCDLLKTIPIVAERYPDVLFQFAGTRIGIERNVKHNQITGERIEQEDPDQCFQTYIAGKHDANYQYLGLLGEPEKIRVLSNCNALILPSYSEGLSMAVLEAMVMGKPVVCTPVGALGDVVIDHKNGLIIEPGDIQALGNSIISLISNIPERERMAERNYQEARKKYSKETIGRRLAAEFKKVINA